MDIFICFDKFKIFMIIRVFQQQCRTPQFLFDDFNYSCTKYVIP